MARKEGDDILAALKEFQGEVMRRLDNLAGLPGKGNGLCAQVNAIDLRLTKVERQLVRLDDNISGLHGRVSENHRELLAAIRSL